MKLEKMIWLIVLTLCSLAGGGNAVAAIDIPCIKVAQAPVVDGSAGDAAWQGVRPAVITDVTTGHKILLRSVYTDEQIFLLVRYPDDAENFVHKPWVWNAATRQYETGPHREDTFVCKWNMMSQDVNLSNFSDDNYRADVWYWKANRTNQAGYADDQLHVLEGIATPNSTELTSSSGKKRYLKRLNDAGKPAYRDYRPVAYEGDLVDAFQPVVPAGSRGDVRARGVWSNGFRTIEFARKLRTGNNDDVVFDPASGRSPLFGISIYSLYGLPVDTSTPNLYGMGRISEPLRLIFTTP